MLRYRVNHRERKIGQGEECGDSVLNSYSKKGF